MKKLIGIFMIVVLCAAGLTACSKNGKSDETKEGSSAEQNTETPETVPDEIAEQQEDTNHDEVVSPPDEVSELEPIKINVYYSNESSDGFETAEAEIQTLSPEALLNVLAVYEMLPADMGFNSFQMNTVDGKVAIDLDMKKEFGEYLNNMGTSGEYMVLGSVVNTFLEANDAELIRITVDGQTLETGHAEYPGYLNKFTQP